MRLPRQALALIILTLLSAYLFWTPTASAAPAASQQQLQRRQSSINNSISKVRQQLTEIRTNAQKKRQELTGVENRLRAARGQLVVASQRLETAEIDLQRATLALETATRELESTRGEAAKRLVAMYERGEPGYLELFLTADDFSELLTRAQLAKFVMERDRTTLESLKERRELLSEHQERVKAKAQEVAQWKQQVAILHNRTADRRENTARELTAQRQQMGTLESQLVALERESAGVTTMLRRLQSSSAGQRRYGTSFGPVSGLPVQGRISSGFGYRNHPVFKQRRMHTGVDIAAPTGTPIHATGAGEVIHAGWRGGYGNTVIIDHGGGRATLYAHMSGFAVRSGQVVKARQVIGYVGSTGVSTGPHLHYEVRINGNPVNPL